MPEDLPTPKKNLKQLEKIYIIYNINKKLLIFKENNDIYKLK